MADPNALYSYLGNDPQLLPHLISWTEEWGQITYRSDVNTFTDEEIQKAGYTGPYSIPSYDIKYETVNWNNETLQYDIIEKSYDELIQKFIENVDDLIYKVENLLVQFILNPTYVSNNKKTEFESYKTKLSDIKENLPKTREEIVNFSWPEIPEYDRLSSITIDTIVSGFSTCINTNELNMIMLANDLDLNYLHSDDQDIIMAAGDEALKKNTQSCQ
ncbi:hypothetical protein EBS02_04310 [bacterium]|nr:hypothetical protein [bacterium]